MFDYKIKKYISGDTFNSLDYILLMDRHKSSVCSEIITFSRELGDFEDVTVVVQFKELIENHIEEIEFNWTILTSIAEELVKVKLDEIRHSCVVINEKHAYVRIVKNEYEFLFETGYDKYYKMFGYGQIIIEKGTRNNVVVNKRLVFSDSDQLTKIFDIEKFITILVQKLEDAVSLDNLDEEFREAKQELSKVLGVANLKERWQQEDNNFERTYGYRPVELSANLNHSRINCVVKLILKEHGFKQMTKDLVNLVLVERRIRIFKERKDEEIEMFGEEEYKVVSEKQLREKYELKNKTNIPDEQLNSIVEQVYDYLKKGR